MNEFEKLCFAAPAPEPARQYYFMEQAGDIIRKRSEETGRPLTFCVQTFGCQMNARDSEKLRGILEKIGYERSEDTDADLVLFNTCTVRENANLKVYGRLGALRHLKEKNPRMIIALCGCMMQEKEVVEKLKESYPFVDLIFGTHNVWQLAELLTERLVSGKPVIQVPDATEGESVEDLPVDRKYSFKSGVNIMYGCNNFCSYCIVPYVRGRERSRKMSEILYEIQRLSEDGVREVMLLGQNVNSYGKGLDEPVSFAELLGRVADIPGIDRVRFMTSHPKDLSDELIDVMASRPNICRHLHLPLQSGSSRVLKIMNRRYTKEGYLDLTERIRAKMPDISLTTDIIVGFPGETEEDFEETLDVVRRVRYDSAFTFIYSKRSGTPAARMENQVPQQVVSERFSRLLSLVQKIGRERTARFTGDTKEVLVETVNQQDPHLVTGRIMENAVVHFPGDDSLIGQIVPVRLDTCRGFYYFGTRAE
ncbi:MAG: tRNA (N6-isopentenyl adenosine(37)-C2)-methylthiotransferase MiaB [Bilifractor sp.]|jgi:tRNA-2-methylthio-N6-dimethylallyladenosine synthase